MTTGRINQVSSYTYDAHSWHEYSIHMFSWTCFLISLRISPKDNIRIIAIQAAIVYTHMSARECALYRVYNSTSEFCMSGRNNEQQSRLYIERAIYIYVYIHIYWNACNFQHHFQQFGTLVMLTLSGNEYNLQYILRHTENRRISEYLQSETTCTLYVFQCDRTNRSAFTLIDDKYSLRCIGVDRELENFRVYTCNRTQIQSAYNARHHCIPLHPHQ